MAKKIFDNSEMVECHYDGAIVNIPAKLFLSMTLGIPMHDKKFVRYKDGARMYGMCQSEFNILVHDAGAVYKRNKMALVNLELLDKYMEFFREI